MKTRGLLVVVAAIALFAACKGKSISSLADSAEIAGLELHKSKLVKTIDINFKVKNVRQAGEAIALLVDKYEGMVMHHDMQSTTKQSERVHLNNDSLMLVSAFNTTANMTVKIPSEKLEDFVNQVNHMGVYINSSKMDIDDRTFDYLSTELKKNNREEFVDQQQKAPKVTPKRAEELLKVKDDIVDKQISNLKTDYDVKFSTVTLSFYQSDTILKEVVANDDPSAYNIPLGKRITLAFATGWAAFMDVLVVLINLWVFVPIGLCAWLAYRYYKKKYAHRAVL
jgi:hypothetical protein